MDNEQLQELEQELDELVEFVTELNQQISALDRELGPFYARKRALDSQVARTHEWISGYDAKQLDWRMGHGCDVVMAWRREGACERMGLFAELDRLSLVHGPTRTARIDADKERRAAVAAANRIRTVLAREAKRRMRREAA